VRVPRTHELDATTVHHVWDNAIPPRIEIDPGDTVVFRCRDSSDGYYRRGMTSADVARRVSKGHPLTGPVGIRGARPGDVLQVDVRELVPGDLGTPRSARASGCCATISPSRTSSSGS